MAVVIDATPGGAAANSYCTLAEANTYHESLPFSSVWDAATDDMKNRGLVEATRLLDSLYVWNSWATTVTQSLQWPRQSIMKRNRLAFVLNTEIPPELKNATAEFARQLIAEDRAADSDIETKKITMIRAGSVDLRFDSGVVAKVVPDAVYNLLPSFWGYPVGRQGGPRTVMRA